jgi:hypothetical protein
MLFGGYAFVPFHSIDEAEGAYSSGIYFVESVVHNIPKRKLYFAILIVDDCN